MIDFLYYKTYQQITSINYISGELFLIHKPSFINHRQRASYKKSLACNKITKSIGEWQYLQKFRLDIV